MFELLTTPNFHAFYTETLAYLFNTKLHDELYLNFMFSKIDIDWATMVE